MLLPELTMGMAPGEAHLVRFCWGGLGAQAGALPDGKKQVGRYQASPRTNFLLKALVSMLASDNWGYWVPESKWQSVR